MHEEETRAQEHEHVDHPGNDLALGATLVGGLVGAAVGVGLHLALEVGANFEAPWFAIVTGLITGLGVRQATKAHAHHVSYARGAITSIIALAAIVATVPLISVAMRMKTGDAKTAKAAVPAADADAEADADAAPAEADAELVAEQQVAPAAVGKPGEAKVGRGGEFNTTLALFMALGALVAYPLGRGSGPPAPAHEHAAEPQPAMDPSN